MTAPAPAHLDPAHAWRSALLRAVFKLLALGIPVIVAGELLLVEPSLDRLARYGAVWLIAVAGAFRSRDPRRLRPLAAAAVGALVALVITQTYLGRPPGPPGAVLLAATAVLAGLFLGGRGALLATLGAEVLGLGLAFVLARHGVVPAIGAHPVDAAPGRWGAVLIPELAIVWLLLAVAVGFVLRRYRQGVRLLDDRLRALRRREVERRAAEAERAAAAHAARRVEDLAVVGRVTAGLAHDLNNAVAVIMSWAELLREPPRPGDEAVRAAPAAIAEAAERAGVLARRFGSLERRVEAEPRERIDLAQLASDLVRTGRWLLPPGCRVVCTRAAPSPVLARPVQLEQVLRNFVLNARDALPEGGTIELEVGPASEAERRGLPAGAFAAVRVRDAGVGMSMATQARLFEPYFSTKPEGMGLGLGLVSARDIAVEHGGRVHVESAPGAGSTFSLVLPAVDGAVAGRSAAAPPRTGGLSGRVLLVEHDELVRGALARVLEASGLTVTEAASFEEGAAAAALGPLDLLVVDPALPDVPGHHVVDAFRSWQPDRPVLICASHVDDPSLQGHLDAGTCALLRKPFDAPALLERVAALLERAA